LANLSALLLSVALPACHGSAPEPDSRPSAATAVTHAGTSLASVHTDPAPEPKPGSRLAVSERCSRICAHSAPLGCAGASECQSFCEELATSLACHSQMDAVLDCFAQQTTDNWECVQEGLPALKDGRCADEQAAYRSCRAKAE
jgi:hypothetical protein